MDAIKNETDPKNKSTESANKDPVKAEEPKKESTVQVKDCTCVILSGNINYII
jgi:hypothetical protein